MLKFKSLATIFSYQTNELDEDAKGFIPDQDCQDFVYKPKKEYQSTHTKDKLESFMSDFHHNGCKEWITSMVVKIKTPIILRFRGF